MSAAEGRVAKSPKRHKMTLMRRGVRLDRERDPGPGIALSSLARDYDGDARVAPHAHAADQLIFATSGVMEVSAGRHTWLIPPQFAVWIPARTRHGIRMATAVSLRTLYFRPGVTKALPGGCRVIHVKPLLRELIVEAVGRGRLSLRTAVDSAIRVLLVSEIRNAQPVPTLVTLPQDPRALRVAHAFMQDPATGAAADLCRRCGVTPRTVQRLFLREVGVSFETWRRQARLMKGIERLMDGESVTSVALGLGYKQPNPFIRLFRDTLGTTPRAWLKRLRESAPPAARA